MRLKLANIFLNKISIFPSKSSASFVSIEQLPSGLTAKVQRRAWTDARRAQKLANFQDRMRTDKTWIAFRDLAIWVQRAGEIEPDRERMQAIYRGLLEGIGNGEFMRDQRSCVLCLHPYGGAVWGRVGLEHLTALPTDKDRYDLLIYCWIPEQLALGWVRKRGLTVTPDLFTASVGVMPKFENYPPGSADSRASHAQRMEEHSRPRQVKHSGGRPPKHDWDPFDQEVSLILARDGLHLTRTELRTRMKDWAAKNMPEPPDDRTIDRHLDAKVSPLAFNG